MRYTQLFVFIAWCIALAQSDVYLAAPSIDTSNLFFYTSGSYPGSASASSIILTTSNNQQGGVVYYNQTQHALYGFETTFVYQGTSCAGTNGGGDGFTFFIARYITTSEQIGLGGGLGIGYKSDVSFVALDPYSNKVVIYQYRDGANAAGNVRGLAGTAVGSFTMCNGVRTFRVVYAPPAWTVYMDGGLIASKTMNMSDNFDADQPLYIGFTASTGLGYMQQAITLWNYTAVLPPAPPVEPVAPVAPPVDPPTTPPVTPPIAPPVFPPFVPLSEIIPVFECFEQLSNDSYKAYLGYNNTASGVVQLLGGDSNQFMPNITGTVPLTVFWPGRSTVYPQTADSFVWDGSSVNWILTDYVVTINTSVSSLCPANISVVISFTVTSKNDTLAQLDNILTALAQLLQISRSRVIFIAITFTDSTKRAVFDNALQAELELEISQSTPETQSEPSAATAVKSLVALTTNQTAMNQVVNGGTDGTNEFALVDVKSDVQAVPGTRVAAPTSAVPEQPTATPRSVPVSVSVSASAVVCLHGALLALTALMAM